MSSRADPFLQRLWYGQAPAALRWVMAALLTPLSWLFALLAGTRRVLFRAGWLQVVRPAQPVVVIGNITVGGTGKTPFTIWLANRLRARGLRVGIVLRGYGARGGRLPRRVSARSAWQEVGDEALLLARRTDAIVVVGADRAAAAAQAIEAGAEIVLSDDGLQHYRLGRDAEIAIVDAVRGWGNGRLLPAGPLREPVARLASVDLCVLTCRHARPAQSGEGRQATATSAGGEPGQAAPERNAGTAPVTTAAVERGPRRSATLDLPGAIRVVPKLVDALGLASGERRSLQSFRGTPVHAIAGIGHPQAFFDALAALGLDVRGHALPDHARLSAQDIAFDDQAPVLMTEKDAVKCQEIVDQRQWRQHWAVRMDLELAPEDETRVLALIERVLARERTPR